MAIPATAIFEVQNGGSDTANGGGFDPGNANMATDLAATSGNTSAPVVTSASYTFVAGDVGHWLFIKSGTNWIAGWYQIASVSAGAATLTAGIGTGYLVANSLPSGITTAAGCASTASPTSGTWTIDYSQKTGAAFTYTDLTAAGSGSTLTSVGNPFGKNCVGNTIILSSGTNVTTGVFFITSVSVVTATFDRAVTTGATSNGAGGLGGASATPGKAGQTYAVSNAGGTIAIKYNATAYSCSATANVASGKISINGGACIIFGYDVTRIISNNDSNKPSLDASATNLTIVNGTTKNIFNNLITTNSAARSGVKGFSFNAGAIFIKRCKASACSNVGFDLNSGNAVVEDCEANACTSSAGFNMGSGARCTRCTAISCTAGGFSCNISNNTFCYLDDCLATLCSGAASFVNSSGQMICTDCAAYLNSANDGFRVSTGSYSKFEGCYAEGSTSTSLGFNITTAANSFNCFLYNCAGFNNAGGNYTGFDPGNVENFQALSTSGFTNPGGNDFSPNNTASAGALLRGNGLPGATATTKLPGLSTNSYRDIGPVQSQASAGLPANHGILTGATL